MKKIALVILVIGALATWNACGGDDDDASGSESVKAPSELMVSEMTGGAHLTWKDNSNNESGFMIERMMGSGSWMTIANVPFDTTVYHDPSLAPGMYMYRVMAMPKSGEHETGKGAYSDEVMLTIAADGAAGSAAAGSGGADGGHAQHH